VSRSWRIAVVVIVVVVAANLLLRFIGSITGGTPGGPRSSSYATSAAGAAAYAELLGRAGHPVRQVRALPHSEQPSPAATVILLDPPAVAPRDLDALRQFVGAGGRLVAAGLSREAIGRLIAPVPQLGPGSTRVRVQRLEIRTDGTSLWRPHRFLVVGRVGRGAIYLLADSSPLQNRLLPRADNAALGLALAGPSARPVDFLESYHGYGRSSGLAALPLAWKLLLGGLGLAALVYMVARGRRFGPPQEESRDLPPARREYVDALAGSIARTRRRQEAVEPVRREARKALLRRVALSPDSGDPAVREAARRVGLTEADADVLLDPVRTDADVLALGRVLARIGQDQR